MEVLMNLVVCSRFSLRALAEKLWGTKENLPQTTKFISTTKLDASGQLIMERRERIRRRRFSTSQDIDVESLKNKI